MRTPEQIAKDIISGAEKKYREDYDKYLQYELNGLRQEIAKLDISFEETTLLLDKDLFWRMCEERIERVRGFNIEYIEWIFEMTDSERPIMTKSQYKKIENRKNLKKLMLEIFDGQRKEIYKPYYIISGTSIRIPLKTA